MSAKDVSETPTEEEYKMTFRPRCLSVRAFRCNKEQMLKAAIECFVIYIRTIVMMQKAAGNL